MDYISTQKRVIIVLVEVFGVNAWVRSVVDWLAAAGVPAEAMHLLQERHQGLICPIRTRIWIWQRVDVIKTTPLMAVR